MSNSLRPPGLYSPWNSPGQNTGVEKKEYPFPSPGDLSDPAMEPRSPVLQADSLLSEPPGKPLAECLLLRRIALTNLDSVLNSRDITLPIKVHIIKAMVFQYSCMDVKVGP